MHRPSRLFLVSVVLGFASALVLIAVTFVVSLKFREMAQVFLGPGEFLVQVSNWICPPQGVECFLGSTRRGAHHLWLLICQFASWGCIFSSVWWGGFRLARRTRARALASRRPHLFHKRQGTS